MKGRVIFLLEEPSMKELLLKMIPRLFPGAVEHQNFMCIPHEGKSDLDKSIPKKLASWREPDVKFVIVRDNDGGDCVKLKARLRQMCHEAGRPNTLIRLVCQELEGWYLGDLEGMAAAFTDPKLASNKNKKRFNVPDDWLKPSVEVERLVPEFQKLLGARVMGEHLGIRPNNSKSFQVFVHGIAPYFN